MKTTPYLCFYDRFFFFFFFFFPFLIARYLCKCERRGRLSIINCTLYHNYCSSFLSRLPSYHCSMFLLSIASYFFAFVVVSVVVIKNEKATGNKHAKRSIMNLLRMLK